VRDAGSGASGSVTVPVKAFFPVEASPAGVAKPPN
jgi:hypothetical protein